MFELANPWLLLLVFIPFLLWYCVPSAQSIASSALQVPFFDSLSTLVINKNRAFTLSVFFYIVWFLLIIALAGPRWVSEPLPMTRAGRNIMLVLDLSDSMQIDDMPLHGTLYSRLSVVKRAATQFVHERIGDRIGLIVFGTHAYLQTPLTYDRANVLERINDATAGLAGKTTSIGDALGLAVKRLQDVPPQSRVIILLTDGVNNSGILAPMKAAQLARDDKIKVYTIGLGSQESSFFGQNNADLDEETLKSIAQMTGGIYYRAVDPRSLQRIYHTINKLEEVKQDAMIVRVQYDYYYWPVAAAWFLVLFWLFYKLNIITGLNRLRKKSS